METAAALAAINGQLIAWPGSARRLIPEIQGDSMPIGGSTVVVEHLPAVRVGAGENQLRSRHPDWPFRADESRGEFGWSSFL
jgi:hypothetical protein